MKFNNKQEVKNAYDLLYKMWGKSWTVYSPFTIDEENLTITFVADAYFDPILSFCKLSSKNVIEAKFEWAGDEKDRVIISGCNMDILQKLCITQPFPDYDTIEEVLNKICPVDQSQTTKPEPSTIILGNDIIPYEDWKKYWALQGKEGPASGWEIPTKQQLYDALNNE